MCDKPSKIIRQMLSSIEKNTDLHHDDLVGIRQAMYEERRRNSQKNPKSYEEAIEQVLQMSTITSREERLVFVESRIVFLTCETNITYLKANSDVILVDGTFYTSPKHFYQLYTIHAFRAYTSIYIHCLLLDKKTGTYVNMWRDILNLCKYNLIPKIILLNFEKAVHDGVAQVFSNVPIKCCRFHFRIGTVKLWM